MFLPDPDDQLLTTNPYRLSITTTTTTTAPTTTDAMAFSEPVSKPVSELAATPVMSSPTPTIPTIPYSIQTTTNAIDITGLPHLQVREESTSILTQTITSSGHVYITYVTLGGDYNPTSVPTPAPEKHLTNGEVGGIIGGVIGFVILLAIGFCVGLRIRAENNRVARWYYDGDDGGSLDDGSHFYFDAGAPVAPPPGPVLQPMMPPQRPQRPPMAAMPPPPILRVNTAEWPDPQAGPSRGWQADPRVRRNHR